MNIAVQIPVKTTPSTRVPNKNFRELGGKPLWKHAWDECAKLPDNWAVFIDTDNPTHFPGYVKTHWRNECFAEDWANGNHLLAQFAVHHPHYDIYIQRFITAPYMTCATMMNALSQMLTEKADSVFTATQTAAWVWFQGHSINYAHHLPDGLPRSQDAKVTIETTGFYAIRREALLKNFTRLGESPIPYYVTDPRQALDIDTEEDWKRAEELYKPQPQEVPA